ncbi:Phage tail assembly chaperone protein, TAC [Streptococcus henryi]|uniref:Phage tail assembly chaperone protein, TAC n=1 Tax=Streptococcus henryi TaxID=439219 RepID=A0A1G6AJN5_9STRE|nr:phage tail tube assembly chaperone [Streptococcus henryi]QBX25316.1 tail assembly protein [Streptococcus phage Javan252]SDB08608.1 Phage tail assembly chaperone protein, TAC [Streptococcus henryi]
MQILKISIPELDKKPFQVPTSNKNVKEMYRYQLAVATLTNNITDENYAEQSLKLMDTSFDYLKDVLKLTDKQIKIIDEEMDLDGMQKIINKVSARLMGMSEEEADSLDSEETEAGE